jgi:formylglycine-generating enzyme required for sulfatase activity
MRELALPVLQVADGVSLTWLKTGSVPTQSAPVSTQSAPVSTQSGPAWRASWMQACGEDKFGRWAAVSIAGVEHRFRWCPPGRFLMGSPKSENGRFADEGPQHEVELTQGFWIGEAPVTQRQWQAVAGSNPSAFKGLDLPVEQISRNDAQAWMSQANARTGALGLRFPTEAEWEYAARAGTAGATYRGGNDTATLDAIAWFRENSGGMTHPVKQKAPNAWGLFDMLGNVWEWCADSQRTYTSARAVNPHGGAGQKRVNRGGSWASGALQTRAASRFVDSPVIRRGLLGFRLARGQ